MGVRSNRQMIFTVMFICSIFPYCFVEYSKIPAAIETWMAGNEIKKDIKSFDDNFCHYSYNMLY